MTRTKTIKWPMTTSQFSRFFKTLILASLLILPLTQLSWAKGSSDKGENKQKSEKTQRASRAQAREQRRAERQSSRVAIQQPRNDDTPRQQTERSRPSRREPQTADIASITQRPNRPDIERRRSDSENPAVNQNPTPQINPSRDNRPNIEAGRPARRERIQRSDIVNEIKPPAETPQVESNRRTEQRQNIERVGREGRNTEQSNDRNRPSRREIAENVSQHIRNRENRRHDTDNSSIFRRDRTNGDDGHSRFVRSRRTTEVIGSDKHLDYIRFRHMATKRVIYEDLSKVRRRPFNYDCVLRDRHHRIIHRIIWPSYYYPVCYDWGPGVSVRFVYPFYQRRFIFVSLGGFWPDYSYVRYYWYPAHSYWWYGYEPVAQEVGGDTYNYYTYNYYGQQTETTAVDTTGLTPVDHTTFADVREKLAQQKALEPAAQTNADTLFDEAVKAFEQANYAEAELKFAQAMALAPEDIILPFAYAQTMLAEGKYNQAADVLRIALQKSTPDKQGVYFPRGLYTDENTLTDQIDILTTAAQNQPTDSYLQLLLGYQLLGIGETDKAIVPLRNAATDTANTQAAAMLLNLAEKIKAGETQ